MGRMHELGLLDCEDRPSIEENFARIKESCDGPVLDENGKLLNEVLPEGYPYEEETEEGTVVHTMAEKFLPEGIGGGAAPVMVTDETPLEELVELAKSLAQCIYHTVTTTTLREESSDVGVTKETHRFLRNVYYSLQPETTPCGDSWLDSGVYALVLTFSGPTASTGKSLRYTVESDIANEILTAWRAM